MNKKSFIQIIPYIIIIIVLAAYYFLNSYESTPFVQRGGLPKYPKGTPFLYQMRYLVYFFFFFLIFFNIYYGVQTAIVSKLPFFENGKAFLVNFTQRQKDIKDKKYKKGSPQDVDNIAFIKSLQVDFESYSDLFCKTLAPCTCCGIGNYAKDSTGKVHKDCEGVIEIK